MGGGIDMRSCLNCGGLKKIKIGAAISYKCDGNRVNGVGIKRGCWSPRYTAWIEEEAL